MTASNSGVPEDYATLVRELHYHAGLHRQPINGTFELTDRCNLKCPMCYVRNTAGTYPPAIRELTPPEWINLAEQAVENGLVFLLLTGGEVFIRPDFFEIYLPLTRMGLILTLFTNGTLITESVAKRLAESPPSRTEITLYGSRADTYESITGVRGSFRKCCTGIETLLRNNIPLGLKTTLTKQNVNEYDAMRQMAKNWGVPFTAGWLLSRRRDGEISGVENCRLPAEVCVQLEANDKASATEWMESAILNPDPNSTNTFQCQAGKAAFVINPAGTMNPCLELTQPSVLPLDLGFLNAWKALQEFVDSAPALDPTCGECEARSFCTRCPAWSIAETGTLASPVPYLCEIACARKAYYDRD